MTNNNIKHSQLRHSRRIVHLTLRTCIPKHSQLARGARRQQKFEVNDRALNDGWYDDASSTSPLVLTHVVVHLGRCCWYLPSVDLNNNSLGGIIIIIIIIGGGGGYSITLHQQPPPPPMMVVVVMTNILPPINPAIIIHVLKTNCTSSWAPRANTECFIMHIRCSSN